VATSAALRQINQARILNTLRKGSWSRVALAEELGLNRSTVTVIISGLLEQGLVRELDAAPSGAKANGRPRVGVALQGSGAYFGGLELGNELLTAVVTDLTGREVGRASEPTRPENGSENAEERLCELLAGVVGDRRLEGIGLTVPGIVSSAGRLEWAPTLDWRDVTLGQTARTRFDVAVYVENDANAAALAEEQLRDASEGDNLLFVLLDSGVGAGLLVHRQLYRGGAGRVGESGHIRLPAADGSTGAEVEEVIGRQAILRAYRSDADHEATWEDLLAAVDAGEPTAEHLRDRWQAMLGWLTAALAWTLDPDVIVFGGPSSALLQSDTTALHRSLRNNGPAGITNVWRLSSLGPQGAALGAVALSQRAFFAIPPLLQPGKSRASLEVAS
jgi:predicted NBD/HSP70 family sugar kinase